MDPLADAGYDTTNTNGPSFVAVRQRLQALIDQKEQELRSAGSLGQLILAQQMELEERINQISELESGRTGLKDDEIESEMRTKLNELADTVQGWATENSRLWSGFGPKSSDDPLSTTDTSLPSFSTSKASTTDGPSAAQSSRRAKNAAHRANDVEFAFEIGSSLLTEVRRLQALLAERDKALGELKEAQDELERTIESLKAALRTQEQSAEKFREENWNLEVTLQETRTQLNEVQANSQRAESDLKRTTKQLTQVRETADGYKNDNEKLVKDLESLRAKHETDVAQMRRTQAGMQREKQDLQTAMDALKADLAKREKLNNLFGSARTNGAEPQTPAGHNEGDQEDPLFTGGLSVLRKTDASAVFGDAYDELNETPDASPAKPPVPNPAAAELESLKQSLAHAHRQIQTLKSSLLREKQLKAEYRRKLGENGAENSADEADEIEEEDPSIVGSPVRRSLSGGRSAYWGSKSRSVTRARPAQSVAQKLLAQKGLPDSPTPQGRSVDLSEALPPAKLDFGAGYDDEDNVFDKGEWNTDEEDERDDSFPIARDSPRPASIVSVEGMDPAFANVLKNAPHAPYASSPLKRVSSNPRAMRRARGGAGFKPQGNRPPSIIETPSALAAELGFDGDVTRDAQDNEEEDEENSLLLPPVQTAEIGVQCDMVPIRAPTPPLPPAPVRPETAEVGVECIPPPVPEVVRADSSTQTTPAVTQEMNIGTDPESKVVPPQVVDASSMTEEPWPIIPLPVVAPITSEIATSPIKLTADANIFAGDATLISQPGPLKRIAPGRLDLSGPPTAYHEPGPLTSRTETDAGMETETEYEDARETPIASTPSVSHDFHSFASSDAETETDDHGADESDSDAESIKVSRLQIRRPDSAAPVVPTPAVVAAPPPPAVEYSTAAVQAEVPKIATVESSSQTDDWQASGVNGVDGATVYKAGPQAQQFQFIPAMAGAPNGTSTPVATPALGPAFQSAVARSRLSTQNSTADRASIVPAKPADEGIRTPGSPRMDRTRPPTMMLPPPPRAPPPPGTSTPTKTLLVIPSKSTGSMAPPPRPSSPPPADLVQRATTPSLRNTASNLSVPSPNGKSTIRPQSQVRQPPSMNSFRSSSAAHQSLNAATFSDLAKQEESSVSSRRSTSSRRLSVSSSLSSEQQHVRTLESTGLDVSAPGRGLNGAGANDPATDPTVIHAITQTMIGEFLYKYTRKAIGKGHAEKRHRRFFWIHPYTRTIYWSSDDPGSTNVSESSAKSAYIESVKAVLDPNPMPAGLHQYSLVVATANREMKFTAPTKDRHDIWFNALNYLLVRPTPSGPASGRMPLSPATNRSRLPTEDSLPDHNRSPRSQRSAPSTRSNGEPFNITPRPQQRSTSRASAQPTSIFKDVTVGKRAGTPAAEFLRYANEPASPSARSYTLDSGTQEYDDELDFEIHDHTHDPEGFDGMENVRACCDGRHDVGDLAGRRHHHHHHHEQEASGTSRYSTQRGSTREGGHSERPTSPSAWSYRSGKSESGKTASMFSWPRRTRKESSTAK